MNTAAKIQCDYDRASLAEAIRVSGVTPGDTLFCHSNVGFFGRPDCELVPQTVAQMFIDAVFDVIGETGTFVVPTFSYSFTKGQNFDPTETPSVCGMLTEHVRKHKDAYRSHHPDFSVAAIGANAEPLTSNVPANAYGPDSFFERFEKAGGIICNFNFDAGSTFVHYVERTINVPYRYDKKFFGDILVDGVATPSHSISYVHDLNNPEHVAAFEPFHDKAVETGIATIVTLGRGNVCTLGARDVRQLIEKTIKHDSFFLTVAHGLNDKSAVIPNHGPSNFNTAVLTEWRDKPEQRQATKAFNALGRIGVTTDTDSIFEIISDLLPISIYEIPTGTSLRNTIIPERWALESATVLSEDGAEMLGQNDRLVAAHSRNFSGSVSGTELLSHIFEYDRGERIDTGGWAIQNDALIADIHPDENYQVAINVINTFGALRYAVLPGHAGADQHPLFIDLSQDAETLDKVITQLIDDGAATHRTILFYVQPFDPAAVYEYHLQQTGAAPSK